MTTDIILDENNEPIIQNGDFVAGVSDDQNVALIIMSNAGEWNNAPLVGVGLHRCLKGNWQENKIRLIRNLRLQVEDMAGYKITRLDSSGDVADLLQSLKVEIR